ncbi:response regulator [Xanthocytophaga agilis]|uniref:Response regulator n=1 Tax=Xanthocytophaga agilis TaxID=3048010 RepID=A0AAE3UBT8_9BACT|nr:response regulator [Xanthocytophaga agilis]MDJ1499410.1 response regulator [Xanthocytophaga agilis]
MALPQTLHRGPILIINDDEDEEFIMEKIFQELNTPQERLYFTNTHSAFDYLANNTPIPFLIICDMMLPMENGVEFKKRVDELTQMKIKSIPFVFMSNAISNTVITDIYTTIALQGAFEKPFEYTELKDLVKIILDYWSVCKQPVVN